jgi:XRE family transcriptional regulator, regulator of sulfur utilization
VDLKTFKKGLGAEIREWRTGQQLSQEKLAVILSLHTNQVGRMERGQANPELLTLHRVAMEMQVSLAALFAAAEKRGSHPGRRL